MHGRPTPLSILAIVALALFTIFITWRAKKLEISVEAGPNANELVGKVAPDFSLYSLEGRKISLADYRGKETLVVSFWASWCVPCQMELPVLRDFYNRNHANREDFEILAIDENDDAGDADAFVKTAKLPFPILADPQGTVGSVYDVESIPALFIIDKDGRVKYGHVGFDATLEYVLAAELGIKPQTAAPGANDDDSSH